MVPGAGLEPAQCFHRRILSPLRLPISPPGHTEGGFLKHYFHLNYQPRVELAAHLIASRIIHDEKQNWE
jgi:hypothetical protein